MQTGRARVRQIVEKKRQSPAVLCLGELLVDFVPTPAGSRLGETETLQLAPGGAPANVAVALMRLGVSSGFIGRAGDDPFGRYLQKVLQRQRVDLTCFGLTRRAPTRLAFVTNDADEGERFLFYGDPGADTLLRSTDLQTDYIRGAKILHFGSISLITEPARSATLAAVSMARRHGLLVSFDPNLRPALWPHLRRARQEILRAMGFCDVVKMNDAEWDFLFPGCRFEESWKALRQKGVSLAALTLGAKGSVIANDQASIGTGTLKVRVIDTTGAGDGFVAGLLHGVLKHKGGLAELGKEELGSMARFANIVGALTATRAGAIPAFPALENVERCLAAS